MDSLSHPALLLVDGVSSIGGLDFQMDKWKVDVAVTGSQKAPVPAHWPGCDRSQPQRWESLPLPVLCTHPSDALYTFKSLYSSVWRSA